MQNGLFYRALLQKRPILLLILLTEATPQTTQRIIQGGGNAYDDVLYCMSLSAKEPLIIELFCENDLENKAFYASWPLCISCTHVI